MITLLLSKKILTENILIILKEIDFVRIREK